MKNNIITIDADEIVVRISEEHEFLLDNKEVARGYGVSRDTIEKHLLRHGDELVEGKHWIKSDKLSDSKRSGKAETLWTKRGVIRLGFFIRSERAKKFRDAAEDLVLRETATGGSLSHLVATMAAMTQAIVSVQAKADHRETVDNDAWGRVVLGQHSLQNRVAALEARLTAPTAKAAATVPAGNVRRWAHVRVPLPAIVEADLCRLLAIALGHQRQAAFTCEQLITLVNRHHLFQGSLSANSPKVALGLILTRCTDRTFDGITITKHRLSRIRRYYLTRT